MSFCYPPGNGSSIISHRSREVRKIVHSKVFGRDPRYVNSQESMILGDVFCKQPPFRQCFKFQKAPYSMAHWKSAKLLKHAHAPPWHPRVVPSKRNGLKVGGVLQFVSKIGTLFRAYHGSESYLDINFCWVSEDQQKNIQSFFFGKAVETMQVKMFSPTSMLWRISIAAAHNKNPCVCYPFCQLNLRSSWKTATP